MPVDTVATRRLAGHAAAGRRGARHTLEKVGPHTLTLLVNDGGTAEPRTLTVTVWAKHVRREIRELSAQDRARYFAALHTMYVVDMDTGGQRYGPHYLARPGSCASTCTAPRNKTATTGTTTRRSRQPSRRCDMAV